jgi:hypothetical protein
MRKRYLMITMVLVALLATGCTSSGVNTVTTPDGTKYKINEEAIKANVGFAKSDEDGNLTVLPENDPDATAIAGIVMAWADLTGNRSWENITGDEEYHLYTDGLKAELINNQNDIQNTKIGYIAHQTSAKAENIKATNVVLLSDTKAYAVVEADGTLLHSADLESAARVGFDGIGSTKHDITEFELEKDEGGDWKISAVNVISDWAQVQ